VSLFANRKGRFVVNSEFELIRYSETLPARIELKQGKIDTPYHWHKEFELIYVMDGEVAVKVNTNDRVLHTDEFLLLNSAENHSLSAENAKCLILDISYEFAEKFDSSLYSSAFRIVGGSGAKEEIHNLLWQLSRTLNEPELPGLRQYSIITDILHVLFVQCKHENTNAVSDEEQARSRHVKLVKEYLQQHFREEITEMEVAKMLGLSPIYLSTLFSKTVGMQFREYLLKIRLEHAMDALLNKHMSIEDAAIAGGFPSKRTFIAKCKRAYNITPFQLMKQKGEWG